MRSGAASSWGLLMAPNLPQAGAPTTRARVPRQPCGRRRRSRSGDQLHPAQGRRREDQGGRRRDRGRPHPQGPARRARRGGRRVGLRPQVRAAAVHDRLHRQDRRGRQGADRRPDHVPAADPGRPRRGGRGRRGRRTPGRRVPRSARCPTPPRSRVALPAADEQHVRAVVEGSMLGGYAFTAYKSGADPQGPADVVVLTDTARTKGAKAAVETARIVSEATALARDWVNTPPGDFTPEIFADAVVAENKNRKAAKVKVDGARRPAAARRRLRRRGRRRPGLGEPAPAGAADLLPARAPRRTSPWSARASPSTPAA